MQDMLNASGFRWDSENKMVTATDEVWDGYIASNPFTEKVCGKHIDRYYDLSFMFGNDITHGSFASIAYSSPLSGRRRSRNELNSDSNTDEYGTYTIRLSSDSGEAHDSGSAPHVNDTSNRLNMVNTTNMDTSGGPRTPILLLPACPVQKGANRVM
ncbi:uncharacterized protein LOC131220428 [Magnolia sinica]|uniref:uncharacterized protein LOC131220428 n=1 Tax=Magnolia sinica TaxID=86752 RepID=UPI002659C55D|nr:uncharacterized protein LOC131220428 [Magnolia sinica]